MAGSRWSEDKSIKFIDIYEKYDCLWNSKSNDYRNKDARVTATNKLISEMKDLDISMTSDEVKNRIKSIRTTYMSELRKVKKSQKSGTPTEDLYVPTVAWYETADRFLKDVVSIRPVFENLTSHSIENTDSNNAETISAVFDYDDITPTTSHARLPQNSCRKRPRNYGTSVDAIAKLKKIVGAATKEKEDEFDIYGKHVASQLRNTPIITALGVQRQISDLLAVARIKCIQEQESFY